MAGSPRLISPGTGGTTGNPVASSVGTGAAEVQVSTSAMAKRTAHNTAV